MTRREIAALACKVLALWTFTQVILASRDALWMLAEAISDANASRSIYVAAAATGMETIVMLLVALFFWFGASRIASWMVSDDPAPVTRPDIAQADIMAVAFSAIGVFTLLPSLRSLAGSLMILVQGPEVYPGGWANRNFQSSFWPATIGLALSLWLILTPRGMVRLVLWARGAVGRRSYEPTDDSPGRREDPPPQA